MRNLNPNDPDFTAKALGEEKDGIISEENRGAFDDLQKFSHELRTELRNQGKSDQLDPQQIKAIKTAPKMNLLRFPKWIGSIAALFLIAFTLPFYFSEKKQSRTDNEFIEHNVQAVKNISSDTSKQSESVAGEHADTTIRSANHNTVTVPETTLKNYPKMLLDESISSEETVLGETIRDFDTSLRSSNTSIPHKKKADWKKRPNSLKTEEVHFTSPQLTAAMKLPTVGRTEQRKPENLPLAQHVKLSQPKLIPFPQNSDRSIRGTRENFHPQPSNETYEHFEENEFKNPIHDPLSTFSIDVDTASYSNVRRMIKDGMLPIPDAIRVEEFINYFSYDYEEPVDGNPFAVHLDTTQAPWNPENKLVRIALKGKTIDDSQRPAANLVFLIDVSGSMNNPNKLPLVKKALKYIIRKMGATDRIAIVVYAGSSGLALPSTTANNRETIIHALDNLSAGGSTNGGEGIELAYNIAQKHFITEGLNRVILCTDGDFNVGTTDQGSLQNLIQKKAQTGIFFSAVGFGKGNYHDSRMEQLSNKGNGNYAYIDSDKEARKVFSTDILGTLYTIAKDVKIQIEFNPDTVSAYRLIGYENRLLADEDFNDDKKDAGEIGAGHTVTAFYEIIPTGVEVDTGTVDELRYQKTRSVESNSHENELLNAKLRYKLPDSNKSSLVTQNLLDRTVEFRNADNDLKFATAVVAFAMKMKSSQYLSDYSIDEIENIVSNTLGEDDGGLRYELLELIDAYRSLEKK